MEKDKLQVLLEISVTVCQQSVYFSDIVSNNSHRPQFLFNVSNSVANPCCDAGRAVVCPGLLSPQAEAGPSVPHPNKAIFETSPF